MSCLLKGGVVIYEKDISTEKSAS